MTVGSRTVSASEMFARRTGSSGPSEPAGTPESPRETWGEKLYAALPLFIVGGACLAIAVDFYYSRAAMPPVDHSSVRLATWALFLALAVTGLSAGVFALLVEDEAPVLMEAPVIEPPPPVSVAPWDESTITPAKPSYVRPRTWEQHPLGPEDIAGWTPAEPRVERISPDVVLVQIDEIAASLRRKTPPSQSP